MQNQSKPESALQNQSKPENKNIKVNLKTSLVLEKSNSSCLQL